MADAETLLNLKEDEVAVAAFLADNGGHLDRDDANHAVYWLTLRPRSAPDQRYYARVAWDAYPHSPPSIKFATGIGGSLSVTSAWPLIPGYRASSFDICRPLSREGYELHPEWKQGPTAWPTEGNPFLWVAQTLQFHLDNEYQGRAA
jgi:hypothetical protein